MSLTTIAQVFISQAQALRSVGRRHAGAILLAIAMGAITIAPQLYAMSHVPGYAGIALMGTDSEDHYIARVQEVYDGYVSGGNVLSSDKTVTPLQPNLGEAIVAYLGMALGLSAPQVVVVGKFIFPFLAALLLYAFVYTISDRKASALLSVIVVMCGDALMSSPRGVLELLRGGTPLQNFLTYARPINPEVTGVFLFGALLGASLLFFQRRRVYSPRARTALCVGSGALAALVLYVSFYAYAFLVAFGGCLLLYTFAYGPREQRRDLLVLAAVALLGAVPFVQNVLHAMQSPAYTESSMRFGVVPTHTLVLGWLVPLMAVGALLLPRRLSQARTFFLLAAAALVLVLNQQALTGQALQAGHIHWYITKPLFAVLLGVALVAVCEAFLRQKRAQYVVYAAATAFLFSSAVVQQYAAYQGAVLELTEAQSYAPLLAYLKENATGKSVWADIALSPYIPMYTSADAPNNNQTICYLLPTEYLKKLLFLEYKLRGVAPKDILATMYRERHFVSARIFGLYYDQSAGGYEAIPDAYLQVYAQEYATFYREPFAANLHAVSVSLVVWDHVKDIEWHLDRIPALHRVADVGRFSIYSL